MDLREGIAKHKGEGAASERKGSRYFYRNSGVPVDLLLGVRFRAPVDVSFHIVAGACLCLDHRVNSLLRCTPARYSGIPTLSGPVSEACIEHPPWLG